MLCSSACADPPAKLALASPPLDRDAQFFRVNDVRSPVSQPVEKKTATFFFANGQEEAPRSIGSTSPALSAVSARSSRSQFFHADGTIEEDEVPPLLALSKHISAPDPTQVDGTRSTTNWSSAGPRPHENFHLSYRKGVSQILRPGNHRPVVPPIPTSTPPAATARRRSASIDLVGTKKHHRTSSLSSVESSPNRKVSFSVAGNHGPSRMSPSAACRNASSREATPTQARGSHLSASPSTLQPSNTFPLFPTPAPLTPAKEMPDPVTTANSIGDGPKKKPPLTISVPQSPTKAAVAASQNMAQLADLAANARRERKVLDLEISNSSLLAINRQLEKEVRKQKAELRRFRRLTRAGRLSAASMMHATIESEDQDDDVGHEEIGDRGLTGISEDEYQSDEDDAASTCASSIDSSMLSPTVVAEKDAKRLERDSKRLQIDLTKHRQLLVDSQNMNQSLKRCMAWTEEMIREGKKQLDYRVRVSDVKLGGRVLELEPNAGVESEETQVHSLLGAWSPTGVPRFEASDGILGLGVAAQRASWQSEDDSGVEVESARTSGVTKVSALYEEARPAPHRLSYEYEVPDR